MSVRYSSFRVFTELFRSLYGALLQFFFTGAPEKLLKSSGGSKKRTFEELHLEVCRSSSGALVKLFVPTGYCAILFKTIHKCSKLCKTVQKTAKFTCFAQFCTLISPQFCTVLHTFTYFCYALTLICTLYHNFTRFWHNSA